jgi:formate hydrogenlyase transcriptional activator
MSAVPTNEVLTSVERLGALLRASQAISSGGDRNHRLESFVRELHSVVAFDYLFVGNCAENAGEAKSVLEVNGRRFEPVEAGMPFQSTGRWAHENRQVLTIADWTREQRFPEMQEFLGGLGIVSTCTLPLTRPDRRIGVLEFGSSRPNAYAEDDVAYLSVVADEIALAIDATLSFMSSEIAESRLKLLLELTNSVVSSLEFRDVLRAISSSVRRVMRCHGVSVALPDEAGKNLRILALDVPEGSALKDLDTRVFPIEGSLMGRAFQTGTPVVVANVADLPPEFPENPNFLQNTEQQAAEVRESKSLCFVPLISRNRPLGVLGLGKRQENGFGKGDLGFLMEVANQVAIAVENALAYREIADLKDKLAQEKLYLEDEMRGVTDFQGIVGQSSALRHVLNLVETVAPSDSTVLLLGETGTGKELIARAIHDRSRRKDRTLVRLNCAAIPTGLLESELFGHEKGAFTGAIAQKIGRLELADQGTLFLDEIGDIPIEIQPKLLRALQEREFERLGSTRTKKVDIRLVAATNRDLERMMEDREFRSDLYYRLNVFPIRIPPLRERPEDIPLLVRYFAQKYGRLMNKDIQTIPAPAIKKLAAWSWPGNIRELENIIERSVILTRGSALHVPLEELTQGARPVPLNGSREASERDDIVRILKATNGRVAGATGAAQRLGLPRTTLISRMKKFGIDPRRML